MRCLMGRVFCGREDLPLVRTLTFLTFKIIYMHKNIYNTEGKGEESRSIIVVL